MKIKREQNLLNSIAKRNIIAIILPYVIISGVIVFLVFSSFIKDSVYRNDIQTSNISDFIDNSMEDSKIEIANLDYFLHIESVLKENVAISDILDDSISINNHFKHIEVIDNNGAVKYASNSEINQINMDRTGEDFYKYFLKKDGFYWSRTFISKIDNQPTIVVAMKNENDLIAGYLNLDYIKKHIGRAGKGTKIAVTDQYGIFIFNEDDEVVSQRKQEPEFETIKVMVDENRNNIKLDYKNNKYNVNAKLVSKVNWYIIVYEPYETVYGIRNRLIGLLLFLFSLIIIIYIIIAKIATRGVSNQISGFVKQTESVADGIFEYIHREQEYSEFTNLKNNFNTMIDKIKERDNKLKELAYRDSLTGLYNRKYLYKELWNKAIKNNNGNIGLVYFDIDNFKNINDTYGHNIGDKFLIEFSELIKNNMSPENKIIRFGGDEFLIIALNIEHNDDISKMIEQINRELEKPIKLGNSNIIATASFGISLYPTHSEELDTLIKYADVAMYEAKSKGKNSIEFFDHFMSEKINKRVTVEYHLRNALNNNEFKLVYQPQINNKDKSIRGFEALLRWKNKELGSVSPIEFIPIAEEIGIMDQIGKFVSREAMKAIKKINNHFSSEYTMAINVSPTEFRNKNYVKCLKRIIDEEQVNPSWIEIEITENIFINSTEKIMGVLEELKKMGIKIALDDFGTGYSSLAYIDELPIDVLKIDRQFIQQVDKKIKNKKMLDAILLLANSLDIHVIAEGIERKEQIDFLDATKCQMLQGYYFSKPIGYEECIIYVRDSLKKDKF